MKKKSVFKLSKNLNNLWLVMGTKKIIPISFLFISLFASVVIAQTNEPIWDFPETLFDYQFPDIQNLGDIESVTWLLTSLNETRYFVFDFHKTNVPLIIYRLNNQFDVDNNFTTGISITSMSKPQVLNESFILFVAENTTSSRPQAFLYNLNTTVLFNSTVLYNDNPQFVAMSDDVAPNSLTSGAQVYGLIKDSGGTLRLLTDWFVNGTFRGIATNSTSLGTFHRVDKAYIWALDGRCRTFAQNDCIFAIVYIGQPTSTSIFGLYTREYRVGIFGLDSANTLLLAIPQQTETDIDMYKFPDPFEQRVFITFTRTGNGLLYARTEYDSRFNEIASFTLSDHIHKSPYFTSPASGNKTNTSLADSFYTYQQITLPNSDFAFMTLEMLTRGGAISSNFNGQLLINISNGTLQTSQSLSKQTGVFEVAVSNTNVSFLFDNVNISSFRNQTVFITINASIDPDTTATEKQTYFGLPINKKYIYTINSQVQPLISPNGEIGFFYTPFVWSDATNTSGRGLNSQYKLYRQDTEQFCICTPFQEQACLNTTHRVSQRFCSPSSCDTLTQINFDNTCAVELPSIISPVLNLSSTTPVTQTDDPLGNTLQILDIFLTPFSIATLIMIAIATMVTSQLKDSVGNNTLIFGIVILMFSLVYVILGIYPIVIGFILIVLTAFLVARTLVSMARGQ